MSERVAEFPHDLVSRHHTANGSAPQRVGYWP